MKKYFSFFFILIIFGCNRFSLDNCRVTYEQCNYGLSNSFKKSRFNIVKRNDSIFYIKSGIGDYRIYPNYEPPIGVDKYSCFSYDFKFISKKNNELFLDSMALDSFINIKNKKSVYYLKCKGCKSSYINLNTGTNYPFDSLSGTADSIYNHNSNEFEDMVVSFTKANSNYPYQYVKKADGIYLRYTKGFNFAKVYEHKQYSFNQMDSVDMIDMDFVRLQYNDATQWTFSKYQYDTIIKFKNKKINCYKFKIHNDRGNQIEFSTIYIDKESLLPVMGSKLFYGLQATDVTNDWGYYNYYITDVVDLKKDTMKRFWRPMNAEDFKNQ